MSEEEKQNIESREMEGTVKVYGSRQIAEDVILQNQPITAVLDHQNRLHIPYRPIGRANTTRSSIDLLEIKCEDDKGTMIQELCWICPIHYTNNIISFESHFK